MVGTATPSSKRSTKRALRSSESPASDTPFGFHRSAFVRGIRSAAPLALPPIPFALAFGLVIAESAVVGNFAGWASGWIMFAGSSQLVAIQLLGEGASLVVIVASIAMINARHVVYSASVSQRLDDPPTWFRVIGSYLLIDQVFAIEEQEAPELDTRERMWLMLGAGVTFWIVWNVMVAIGLVAGDLLPDDFPVGFVVALLFGGLMALAARTRPGVVAAIVGGTIAMVLRDLPSGTGLMVAIVVGAAAGAWAEASLA